MKILTIVLLLSMPSLGQTLSFVDDSPSDSPMSWRGTVTYDQHGQASCAVTAYDHDASRMVVAYRVQFDILGQDGKVISTFNHRDDRFFKPEGLLIETSPQPKLDWPMPDFCEMWLSVQEGLSNTLSGVHIKTIFVQFDDGRVWGDADIVKEIMYQRNAAINHLKALKAAYESGGPDALTEALKQIPQAPDHKPEHQPVVAWTANLRLRELPDTQSQRNQIDADLAVAETRSVWLK